MWLKTDSLFFHGNVSLISRCLQETRFSFKPKMCAKEKSWVFFSKNNLVFLNQNILWVMMSHFKWFDIVSQGCNSFSIIVFQKKVAKWGFSQIFLKILQKLFYGLRQIYVPSCVIVPKYQGAWKKPSQDSNVVLEESHEKPETDVLQPLVLGPNWSREKSCVFLQR